MTRKELACWTALWRASRAATLSNRITQTKVQGERGILLLLSDQHNTMATSLAHSAWPSYTVGLESRTGTAYKYCGPMLLHRQLADARGALYKLS